MKLPQRCTGIVHPLALALVMSIAPAAAVASTPRASASASVSAAACEAPWGSLPKRRAHHSSKQVTDVRSGEHACFDRLVIDLNGAGSGRPGHRVAYVAHVTVGGSGATVPLRGRAQLRIIITAPAYDDHGRPTYHPADERELVDVSGYRTFRQVAWAGSYEGQTTIGLGVRARLPMRVTVLNSPDGGHRVVVDVAHRW